MKTIVIVYVSSPFYFLQLWVSTCV